MGQKGTSSPHQWSEQSTHSCIWSGRQLDDQQRNPNMSNRDYLVGQLTNYDDAGAAGDGNAIDDDGDAADHHRSLYEADAGEKSNALAEKQHWLCYLMNGDDDDDDDYYVDYESGGGDDQDQPSLVPHPTHRRHRRSWTRLWCADLPWHCIIIISIIITMVVNIFIIIIMTWEHWSYLCFNADAFHYHCCLIITSSS